MRSRVHGFTLIEIAIALAIITLITGAILMSRGSIMGRANIASLLTNIKDLATASRDFKTRYGYFPGDLPNAVSATGITGICSVGNGNGIVDTNTESNCALEHLVKAGMLSKVDYDGTQYLIKSNVGEGVRLSLWHNSLTNENVIRISSGAPSLPCDTALEIDRKLDSATTDDTPFDKGSVTARNTADTVINTCVPLLTNDPVATLLIKY